MYKNLDEILNDDELDDAGAFVGADPDHPNFNPFPTNLDYHTLVREGIRLGRRLIIEVQDDGTGVASFGEKYK